MTEQQPFDPAALTKAADEAFTVRRVFGEAYEQGGVTLIPVARVLGMVGTGAGGGEGAGSTAWLEHLGHGPHEPHAKPAGADAPDAPDTHGFGHGGGGGFGTWVQPLGVFVVDAKGARWQPTFDANLLILGAGLALTIVASSWTLARALHRH
ncbi:MAG TPA: spore germination protein GerW family protein [Cellulomonas sp.]